MTTRKKIDTLKETKKFGADFMKLLFGAIAALVVVMSVMYSVVAIVIRSEIFEGLLVGGVGVIVLIAHLNVADPPNFDDDEDS